jgi:hypothetical protein
MAASIDFDFSPKSILLCLSLRGDILTGDPCLLQRMCVDISSKHYLKRITSIVSFAAKERGTFQKHENKR